MSVDGDLRAGLGRAAVVLRLVGALWIVLLVLAAWAADQLTAPTATWVVTAGAVLWAIVLARGRWLESTRPPAWVAVADVAMAVGVVVGPALTGEQAGVSGGYPFASLLVGLAVAGQRAVVGVAALLSVAVLTTLASLGRSSATSVASNVLLYLLGAVALVLGVRVLERQQARARATEAELAVATERASTAAHLHDSVLQTLALVQRRAEDPGAVRSLARRQERELREWLFPGEGAPAGAVPLDRALAEVAEQVQADHDVAVRLVAVGGLAEVAVQGGVKSLVGAAREAMANAAVHAGVEVVDVFAERVDGALTVYVRDRGSGFVLEEVPADRHGVRGSILGRMAAAGGRAGVTSTPGRGTEVQLHLPGDAAADSGGRGPTAPSPRRGSADG